MGRFLEIISCSNYTECPAPGHVIHTAARGLLKKTLILQVPERDHKSPLIDLVHKHIIITSAFNNCIMYTSNKYTSKNHLL